MKFVLIFGPGAVGKMTVGQELEKITGLKLFHNHMTIELVRPFFRYSSEEGQRLVHLFRMEMFEAVAKSDLPGMIFTMIWIFNNPDSSDYVDKIYNIFASNGAEIYFVELEADYNVRMERNKTPNRLLHKPSKREYEFPDQKFVAYESDKRCNSLPGEIKYKNYIRINNTDIEPAKVAETIKSAFAL